MIETKTYVRKPLYVEAVQVTNENFEEMVTWCNGSIEEGEERGRKFRYIFVQVSNPMNIRQSQARVGDWILTSDRGYKIYTPKAFENSFDETILPRLAKDLPLGDGKDEIPLPEQTESGLVQADTMVADTQEERDPNVVYPDSPETTASSFEQVPDEEAKTLTVEE